MNSDDSVSSVNVDNFVCDTWNESAYTRNSDVFNVLLKLVE